jgi:hypothetical protein
MTGLPARATRIFTFTYMVSTRGLATILAPLANCITTWDWMVLLSAMRGPLRANCLQGYHADKGNARFTVRHFRLLLNFLAKHTDAEQINILAHSAGAPIVVDTLRHIRFLHDNDKPAEIQRQTKIGLVMLGAPDGDMDWFVNACLDGWMQAVMSVNVYASKVDRALKISSGIYEAPRTGAAVSDLRKEQLEALQTLGNLSVIDVTSTKRHNKRVSGHAYHHMNAWVSSDALLSMKFGISPEQRGLVQAAGGAFYTFPEDYGERVQPIARALYESESGESEPTEILD